MLEEELRTTIWRQVKQIKEDVSILYSSLTVLDHAMKTGFHQWDVYEDLVYGLANQACTLQEELACLRGYLKEEGLQEE